MIKWLYLYSIGQGNSDVFTPLSAVYAARIWCTQCNGNVLEPYAHTHTWRGQPDAAKNLTEIISPALPRTYVRHVHCGAELMGFHFRSLRP